MKASEALMIGSMLIRGKAAVVYEHDPRSGVTFGCALGMIAAGNGFLESRNYSAINDFLPGWMNYKLVTLPCACGHVRGFSYSPYTVQATSLVAVASVVAHIFDNHIFGLRDWTIERLADWLRSVEPRELPAPAPEVVEVEALELEYAAV